MRRLSAIFNVHKCVDIRRKCRVRQLARAAIVLCLLQTIGDTVANSAAAQRSFALEVNVVDERGAPIPSAKVSLHGSPQWEGQTVTTQAEGRFAFTGLNGGEYWIVVSAADFLPSASEHFLIGAETVRIVLLRHPSPERRPTVPQVSLPDLAAPRDAQAKYREGLARQKEGHHQEGRRHFLAAIEIYPEYSAAYAGLGISLLQLRERDEALEALKKALELNPSSYDAQLCTGLILNDLGRFSEARGFLLGAQRLSSRDWRVHYEIGRMYYGLNRFSEAEKSLQLARRSQPRYGNLYLLLANTLTLQGKHAEAIVEFEEFLEMAPSNPASSKVRKKLALLRAEVQSHKSPRE